MNPQAASRFTPLHQRAVGLEDRSAQALAAALGRHAQAEDRHAELCRYEAEYAARQLPASTGVNVLRQHAAFLARLREAVRFQADRLALAARELERAQQHWLASHREVEKLERLMAQCQQEAVRVEARRQSREQDEAALRIHLRQQSLGVAAS